MPQGSRLDPALGAAAAQLRAACRELTHDHDQLADVATIARRVDLAAALPVLARYVDAAAELAEATRPPLRDPELVAPARAVVRRLAQDIEDGLLPDNSDALGGDLIAIAARSNRLGPVPEQLTDALNAAASKAGRASAAAANNLAAGARYEATASATGKPATSSQRPPPAVLPQPAGPPRSNAPVR